MVKTVFQNRVQASVDMMELQKAAERREREDRGTKGAKLVRDVVFWTMLAGLVVASTLVAFLAM